MSTERAPEATQDARAGRDEKIELAKEKLEELDADATKPIERPSDPAAPIPKRRAWWHRHLPSEERQRVLSELGIKRQPHWAFRFFTMLGLSVIVAVMGLSANSAAVVIGAMLLAPLMQPVLAAAACISMGLFKKSLQFIGIVLIATVASIALSYVLAAMFSTGELSQEVLSRTAPDMRDLVVALGAGTAGAYATVRSDVSSSLPGVAVAVALVPPLGAVGMSLEADRETLAEGALLLYTTNLAAIIFAASIVFVATGFVPPRRLRNTFRRTSLAALLVAGVVIAIAIPLYRASRSAVERTDQQLAAIEIVNDWLGPVTAEETPEIAFSDERILVRVRSFEEPPDQKPLVDTLQQAFGEQSVSVEWEQLTEATTTTTTTTVLSDADRLQADVERIVDEWLQDGTFVGRRSIDALTTGDGVVSLDASGVGQSPSLPDLIERLDDELDVKLDVQLTWVERREVAAGEPDPTPEEITASEIRGFANTWAIVNDLEVIEVSYDGVSAVVEVAGATQPNAANLVRRVEEVLPEDATLNVLFTQRLDITTTTTTTTTTTVAPTTTG